MESEVRSLRQEVARTRDSLRAAARRCRELVRELDGLSVAHERERGLREQQLARILRALLVLESRLKREQKSIGQLLCDKDSLIRSQQLEIARLRRQAERCADGQREPVCGDAEKTAGVGTLPSLLPETDYQEHESGLSKDIQKLKCEIMTKLNESLEEGSPSSNIRKTHSFAGSDISKASLTSSENTDASIITTTTDGSPSLLSTEGFCEGESTDVSPGSTLNKSSARCTPTIVTTDSETEVTMVILDERQPAGKPLIARSESKDDGMDCNYVSDEDEDEPIYENNLRNLHGRTKSKPTTDDCSNNNVQLTITRLEVEEGNQDESSSNWYSDPDEDRLNDEILRHSVYRPSSRAAGNHNSVLECVNQILLRDMEDEERVLAAPRRFRHRGKIVRFQPARLSDIESVGSEMERRNSEEPSLVTATPVTITTTDEETDKEQRGENEEEEEEEDGEEGPEASIDGFEPTNSEDEYGMRIVPAMDPESGLEEDVDETKARPIVIIEPCVNVDEPLNSSSIKRSLTTETERLEEKTCKGLTIAKNLDYEDIESLPEMITPATPVAKVPPVLPPKPQFHNTLILKKIPSPSFLIDETSRKKQNKEPRHGQEPGVLGIGKPPLTSSARCLRFDGQPSRKPAESCEPNSFWKNRFNNVRSSFTLHQHNEAPRPEPAHPAKVTSIVKQFEEFKIEGGNEPEAGKRPGPLISEAELDDIQQNFEEFNLDECDLSDEPERPEADGSEALAAQLAAAAAAAAPSPPALAALEDHLENNNNNNSSSNNNNNNEPAVSTTTQQQLSNGNAGNYDSFLEATGLSNKSILTPSRLLSNHKSMLKPKDVKYKSKIKASAVLERHGAIGIGSLLGITTTTTAAGAATASSSASTTTLTKHWTGPFV